MKPKGARPASARGSAQDLLAAARFGVPELLRSHVARPRLRGMLEESAAQPLVVVSGPAGTGKTSLLAEWVRDDADRTTAWVTFEDGDGAFWSCVVESLTRSGVEVPAAPDLAEHDPPLGRERLRALTAALAQQERRWTVVVDGYEMTSLELAREVDYLLRHTLGRLQMVLSARVDPVLPLYRYRLDDSLAEVRAADLAFTDDEAQRLIAQMGVTLAVGSVRDLNHRVKGWAAGLRFAARALAGRADPDASVAGVVARTGDISEYLLGEVLDVQSDETRRFMLDSSVPDLLSPGMLTELTGAQAPHLLEEVAKANAFLEPLPEQPGAYRYYPFFRNLLRAQLAYEDPERLRELHRRAADWYLSAGMVERSLGHLAAVGAWTDVARQLVEQNLVGRVLLEGPEQPLSGVAGSVPADVDLPEAAVVRASVALARGDVSGCGEEIAAARRTPPAESERSALWLSVAVVDAARASLADDAEVAAALVEDARKRFGRGSGRRSEGEAAMYALVQLSVGVTSIRRGDLRQARKALTIAVGLESAHRYASFRADCLGYLALLEAVEGNLARARRAAEEASTVAEKAGALSSRTSVAEVTLACVSLEQYDIAAAREHVAAAVSSRATSGDPVSRTLVDTVIAGLDRAAGRLQPALARLEVAATRAASADRWLSDRMRVEAARLAVASGRAEIALQELERVDVATDVDAAVVAAVAHAEMGEQSVADEVLALVGEEQPRLVVQVTALLAEAAQESRRHARARARLLLEQALRLAEPEQLRRPFREAGPQTQRLLAGDPQLLHEHAWLTRAPDDEATGPGRGPARANLGGPAVLESLTPKELEVLGHLEELLTTEEIAQKMFVSVNTVRTHVRSILRKLGVTRRNAAVRRARGLGIFVS